MDINAESIYVFKKEDIIHWYDEKMNSVSPFISVIKALSGELASLFHLSEVENISLGQGVEGAFLPSELGKNLLMLE